MSTAPPPPAEAPTPPAARQRFVMPAFLREPLVHFAILGGVLFGVDHYVTTRAGDPRVIQVDPAVDAQAIKGFKDARGPTPTAAELFALRRVWLDNEVLYREGVAMGLDKG